MSDQHLQTLRQARENLVGKRRYMSEEMTPPGAAAAHFAPSFTDLQAVIEALDRAMADEQQLPEGYAPEEREAIPAASSGDSNVVDIDFDPA